MKKNGFTLVELLVVISIIAILSVIGITVFSSAQNAARVSATKEELRRLQQAMISYKVLNGELPPVGDSCPNCFDDNETRAGLMRTGPLAALASASSGGGPYISNIEEFVYDAWGQAYYYDDNDAMPTYGSYPCQSSAQTLISALYSSGPDKNRGGTDNISFHIPCP